MKFCSPTLLNGDSELQRKKHGINVVLKEALRINGAGSKYYEFSIKDPINGIKRTVCETGLLMVAGLQFKKGEISFFLLFILNYY